MELRPRRCDKIVRVMREGADLPYPLTLDISDVWMRVTGKPASARGHG